jgi:hypothetical protein
MKGLDELIAKIEIPESKGGKSLLLQIGAEDPLAYAARNGFKVDGKDAIAYAIENNLLIDGKKPLIYADEKGSEEFLKSDDKKTSETQSLNSSLPPLDLPPTPESITSDSRYNIDKMAYKKVSSKLKDPDELAAIFKNNLEKQKAPEEEKIPDAPTRIPQKPQGTPYSPIKKLEDVINNLIGDIGRDSNKYVNVLLSLGKYQKAQSQENSSILAENLGILYATNPVLQNKVTIKKFVESLSQILKGIDPNFNSDSILKPIVSALNARKIKRHDTLNANKEDFEYLKTKLKDGKVLTIFDNRDRFTLARFVRDKPDRVLEYLTALNSKSAINDPNQEEIEAFYSEFASDESKKNSLTLRTN